MTPSVAAVLIPAEGQLIGHVKVCLFPSMHQAIILYFAPTFAFPATYPLPHSHPPPHPVSSPLLTIKQVGTGRPPRGQDPKCKTKISMSPSKPPSYVMHATKFGNSGADVMTANQ